MQRRDLRKLEIEKQQHIKSPEWRQLNANAYIHMQTNTTPPPVSFNFFLCLVSSWVLTRYLPEILVHLFCLSSWSGEVRPVISVRYDAG